MQCMSENFVDNLNEAIDCDPENTDELDLDEINMNDVDMGEINAACGSIRTPKYAFDPS